MREIEIKPSRWLGLLLAGMTGLAWGALWLAALPPAVGLALAAAVAALALRAWRGGAPPAHLRLRADGGVQLRHDADDWTDIAVRDDSFVSAALVVLRYRTADGRTHARALLHDSADADALRRLRVSLRWAARTRSDTASPGAG